MANRTSAALFAAIFTLAGTVGAVMAQETPAPAAPAAEAPAATAPAATPAPADAAAPANAAPQPGQTYAKSTHGDWTLRCMKAQEGQDPCELYQLLKDPQGAAVAETSVLPMTGDVKAVVTFVAPLETDLQAGLGMQIDNNEARRYPFMLCAQVGCISRLGLTDAEVGNMKRGKTATVSLLPFGAQQNQVVKLSLSLSGFTAGMEALAEANKGIEPAARPVEAPTATPAPAAQQ